MYGIFCVTVYLTTSSAIICRILSQRPLLLCAAAAAPFLTSSSRCRGRCCSRSSAAADRQQRQRQRQPPRWPRACAMWFKSTLIIIQEMGTHFDPNSVLSLCCTCTFSLRDRKKGVGKIANRYMRASLSQSCTVSLSTRKVLILGTCHQNAPLTIQ